MGLFIRYPSVGGAVNWKAPVAAVGDLPASGNTLGDARVVTDDDTIYVWDGSAWQNAGGASGDVTGPASSLDNELAQFDGTTGKVLQAQGGITYDVSGSIGTLTLGNASINPVLSANKNGANFTINGNPGMGSFIIQTPSGSAVGPLTIRTGTPTTGGTPANITIQSLGSAGAAVSGGTVSIIGSDLTSSSGTAGTTTVRAGNNGGSGAGGALNLLNGTSTSGADGIVTIGASGTTAVHRLNIATVSAGANTATLGNSPGAATDPDLWVKININGTDYIMPLWAAP